MITRSRPGVKPRWKRGLDFSRGNDYICLGEYNMKRITPHLKAIADESRLRILNLLIHRGELCVCDIEAILEATQTKVSRHLAYLRRTGLVRARRSGLWILYSLAPPQDDHHRAVLAFLSRLLSSHPAARKDLRKLDTRMGRGCCATQTALRSPVVTQVLELNRN